MADHLCSRTHVVIKSNHMGPRIFIDIDGVFYGRHLWEIVVPTNQPFRHTKMC